MILHDAFVGCEAPGESQKLIFKTRNAFETSPQIVRIFHWNSSSIHLGLPLQCTTFNPIDNEPIGKLEGTENMNSGFSNL